MVLGPRPWIRPFVIQLFFFVTNIFSNLDWNQVFAWRRCRLLGYGCHAGRASTLTDGTQEFYKRQLTTVTGIVILFFWCFFLSTRISDFVINRPHTAPWPIRKFSTWTRVSNASTRKSIDKWSKLFLSFVSFLPTTFLSSQLVVLSSDYVVTTQSSLKTNRQSNVQPAFIAPTPIIVANHQIESLSLLMKQKVQIQWGTDVGERPVGTDISQWNWVPEGESRPSRTVTVRSWMMVARQRSRVKVIIIATMRPCLASWLLHRNSSPPPFVLVWCWWRCGAGCSSFSFSFSFSICVV